MLTPSGTKCDFLLYFDFGCDGDLFIYDTHFPQEVRDYL